MARSLAAIALPGGLDRAAARGSRKQKALLRTMIGDDDATIGESVAHVSRVA